MLTSEKDIIPVVERRKQKNIVEKLDPEGAAARAGIRLGDRIVSANGAALRDIVDWKFHVAGEEVVLEYERDGERGEVRIVKGYDEDLGITFADDLFDRIHICKNKCVFCFLYQQPKGMRGSLYVKDDDYRLSFLHGNYITLTNMKEEEFQRIIEQKLSPIYVSIHATDPAVRSKMLGRPQPEAILPRLNQLADAKIQIHGQVVLCPGYNDGAELERTVTELAAMHPEARETFGGVMSLAVVPVGVTQFRDRQAPMKTVDPTYAGELLDWAEEHRKRFLKTLGSRFLFMSDEFYLNAGREIPPRSHYEGYPQLEDGVGLVRLFIDDIEKVRRGLPKSLPERRSFTLVTGEMAGPLLHRFADAMNRVEGLDVNVCVVHNRFFEGNISVAGLLTGKDIIDHLTAPEFTLHDTVIVPSVSLRSGDPVFLDDITLDQMASTLRRRVMSVERMPSAAAAAMLN